MEKIKNIAIFLAVVLGISVGGQVLWNKYAVKTPANYDITPGPVINAKAEIIVEGVKTVKVGQLARLEVTKSSGKTFKWTALPEGTDFEVYDDGRRVVFSSGTPGSYTFIVACANDNDVDVKVVIITVGAGDPAGPVDPAKPVNPTTGLKGKVVEWTKLVNSPNKKAEAAKLSVSFATIQADITSGKLATAEQIIAATKAANQATLGNSIALWVPFLEQLQKEMRSQAESGLLVTSEQHAQVWGEISAGLSIVSK
jgi:hypothetical protein